MAVTGSRREARERALGLCYELEVRELKADALLSEQPAPPDAYAAHLVRGVEEHHDDVDALLRKFSEHWALERMPAVDRAVLRLGAYELGWEPDMPTAVVISEAVELAVTDTEPGVQGDRVSGARKPATLATGLVVQVPLFVEPGERIKVDTRTGEYLARA